LTVAIKDASPESIPVLTFKPARLTGLLAFEIRQASDDRMRTGNHFQQL
jgi:hypothetical protein